MEDYIITKRHVKYARIHVNNKLVVKVVVPIYFTKKEINSFIERKKRWINKKLEYFKNNITKKSELKLNQILFLGEIYTFYYKSELKKYVLIDYDNKTITANIDPANKEQLNKWHRKEAKKLIIQRVEKYSQTNNFNYNRIFIRDQKTRWGSCSSKRNLSFNWRLIKAPLFVLDYVVIHELLHIHLMNHKKVFWTRLYTLYPDYQKARDWLTKHGKEL